MEGLNGVIFVQSIHYFPFILINLSAALRNIDGSMEEAAQNLGASGFRLFRRIVFPLAMPGYIAGASLVFVKVFDDLATPLLLNVKDMLAPQAYLRVTSIGIADPDGLRDLGGADRGLGRRHGGSRRWPRAASTTRPCSAAAAGWPGARCGRGESVLAYLAVTLILLLVLAPHVGLLLLSFATSGRSRRCRTAYTLAHYAPRVRRKLALHQEHADLCVAGRPDRRRARHRDRLSRAAHAG